MNNILENIKVGDCYYVDAYCYGTYIGTLLSIGETVIYMSDIDCGDITIPIREIEMIHPYEASKYKEKDWLEVESKYLGLIKDFGKNSYNCVGGRIHIILADKNIGDNHIEFCMRNCIKNNDLVGIEILSLLSKLSLFDRYYIINKFYYRRYQSYFLF